MPTLTAGRCANADKTNYGKMSTRASIRRCLANGRWPVAMATPFVFFPFIVPTVSGSVSWSAKLVGKSRSSNGCCLVSARDSGSARHDGEVTQPLTIDFGTRTSELTTVSCWQETAARAAKAESTYSVSRRARGLHRERIAALGSGYVVTRHIPTAFLA